MNGEGSMRRWLKRGLWLSAGLAVLAAGGFFYLRSSLPSYSGRVAVTGLSGKVEIVRDSDAIPHIIAGDQRDASFAIGYAHAQDRLWQLEMNRRIGQGRLSEILGKDALDTDKFMRVVGFYRQAEKTYANLDAETKSSLEAYAAGINAYMATRSGALPPEFIALGVKPAPWRPADSIVWLKLMSLDLGYQWRTELARFSLSAKLPMSRLNELLPPYPGDAAVALPKPENLFAGLLPPPVDANETQGKGSNNWVVAGSRTISGKPLLANDPHLTLTTPGIWYLAHLRMGTRNVVGVTMPSVPFVVLGRTDTLAWGFTNTAPDTQDLIVEKILDPTKGTYATPTGEATLTTRTELIKVKDSADVALVVRESRNGPILSDALEKVSRRLGDKYAIAIRWIALDAQDPTARAGFQLNMAGTIEEAISAAQDFKSPQQNIVMADTTGKIAYFAAGRVPIRSPKHPTQGLMPTPGWMAESDWIGEIPYNALPQEINPSRGFVATANQKVVAADYPYTITHDWEDADRYSRIVEMIEATPKHSVASFQKMQGDVLSHVALDQRNVIVPLLRNQKAIPADLVSALAAWDGEMSANSPLPLVMTAWHRFVVKRVTEDDLGALFKDNWRLRTRFVSGVLKGESNAAQWCDVQTTQAVESCKAIVVLAMEDALADLRKNHGQDWKKWQWGTAHQAVGGHRPFSAVPQLAARFDIRRSIGGSTHTVNVAHPKLSGTRPYDTDLLPSYRGIFDLSDLEKSQYVQPTGQSGNIMSGNYSDFADRWASVQYRAISTRDAVINAEAKHRLTLVPAGAGK
jgi:penicillin G amidase